MKRDLKLIAPATALLAAWSAVPAPDRALLELLLESPAPRVEPLEATTATDAGSPGRGELGRRVGPHGHANLTRDPTPLRTIDPAVGVEQPSDS